MEPFDDTLMDTASMDSATLQTYLREGIPLCKAMAIEVVDTGLDAVVIAAPLAPNLNNHHTVFGGSVSAVAMLSAWALLRLRLRAERLDCLVVIQRNSVKYERPVDGRFTAEAALSDPAGWSRFMKTLRRRGRARVNIASTLHCEGRRVASFEGDFVALADEPG